MQRRRAIVPATALTVGLVGCGSGGESVPVPGADAVVTAPVASVERPLDPTPAATDAPAITTEEAAPTTSPAADSTPTTPAPATTPPATPAPVEPPPEPVDEDVFLRLGDEGPEVASMQAKLASIDYISSDFESGVFDEATRRGVRRFQGDYGLGVDGIFGPITLRALNAAVSSINAEG